MGSFKHRETGVLVSVAEGKKLGPEWVPVDNETPKTRTTRNKKADDKSE